MDGGKDDEVEGEVEPVELLDDYWFFRNLLQKRNRMVRSASDPYPGSCSMAEVFAQIQKGSKEAASLEKNDLKRTPSLPVSIGMEKGAAGEKEVVPRSSRLSRQTSLCYSNVLPPLHASKTTTSTPGMPKNLSRRQSTGESTIKNSKPRYKTKDMMQRSLSLKSPSQLEIEEVQGFKDLGFDFDKLKINPSVADIIPGLQSKRPEDWDEDKVRRPYLSEAWHVRRPTPVMPEWVDHGSVGDVKKQLKYWARAVASNMRQEC